MRKRKQRRVIVTEKDIETGMRGGDINCPISKGMSRLLGRKAHVGEDHAYVHEGKATIYFTLPDEICTLIAQYDDGEDIYPLCFITEVW